ncbi:MAG: SxtJ family membrane protein [Gammaproteobacteria bacterium]|nr:SxtJ family membrane protein [Gammaproteobacteria bacterium]MDH5799238.1 SxtJ family membrane protein [Gammaproteobacteria bacterium]
MGKRRKLEERIRVGLIMENHSIDNKMLRSFGITFGVILASLFGILIPLITGNWPMWPWIVCAIFVATAAAYPPILKPVYIAWMKFGAVMGYINTRIILALVFYLVFTPIGLILKLLGKDSMQRTLDQESKSYRVESKPRVPNEMEKPF